MNTMKNEDKHNEFRDRAVKYLAGEMNASEKEQFERDLGADEEKLDLMREFTEIWEGVDRLAARSRYDLDSEWDQMATKIDFGAPEKQSISLRGFILRIAAVLLIGMAGLAGFLFIRNHAGYEEIALQQVTQVIEMIDGSQVTLNAGSTLKYAIDEISGERKVILSGEAFFEVARDSLRPFIIEAGSAIVEVLGTSFNVRAYKENETVEVTVNSGLVSMAAKRNSDEQIILNPGNSGIYYKNEKALELQSKANPNAFAWKSRELVFADTPLSEVVDVINHVYHQDLRILGSGLSDCQLTVSFSQQEFDAVLKVLVSTLDLEVSRKDGAILLSGDGCD